MSKEELLPKLRFEDFSTVWEKRTLGELGNVAMNKRIFKNQTSEKGDIPFYKIGTFGKEPDAYISRELFDEYKSKYSYPKIGDILISASGSIGRTVEYKGRDEYFQDSNIVWLNHNGKIDNHFLKQFYKIVTWHGLEGSTIKRLYNSNILNTEIILPILEEQNKIGSFFRKIDEMIQLQQSKVNKVKDLKSAYLSEMFPKEGEKYPKKRFEGFTDPWKETRLSDFVSKAVDNRGKTPPLSDKGTHPLIEVASIGDYYPNYSKVEKYLDGIAFDNNLRGYIKQNDILFSTVGRIGLVSLMDHNKDAAIAQNIVAFRATENNIPEYIYALLSAQTNKEKSERIVMGAVQPSIKVSQLENVKYLITDNIKEQQLIGSFFAKLENIIIYNQNHLIKLKELKKAYLNDMFV